MKDTRDANSTALLRAVFDCVPGLLYIYTEDGRLVQWNKQHEIMTGYTSEELMNFPAEDWFDENDRITLAREWPKIFSDGRTQAYLNLIRKDGRKVPFFLSDSLVIISQHLHKKRILAYNRKRITRQSTPRQQQMSGR